MKRGIRVVTAIFILLAVAVWSLPHLGFVPYQILSDSMYPVLRTGDTVLINTHDCEPVPGKIIAFHLGSATVIHRVEAVSESGVITKGDDNPAPDPGERTSGQIIGSLACGSAILAPLWVLLSSGWRWSIILSLAVLNIKKLHIIK